MRELTRVLLVVGLALAAPIVPLLVVGDRIEGALTVAAGDRDAGPLFALVVGILAVDVFLPVPSSGVGTLAGARLGALGGTTAVWVGMMIGAILGFGLARAFGRPIACGLAGSEELDRLRPAARRWGPWLLFVTRPLPILAEASVLLLGATGLSWRGFWWPVALANLVLAACYATLGDVAGRHGWLGAAVVFAVILPVAGALLARRHLNRAS
jgi:uncharacterized membrane protein YdjX (TVP38/TMEM64 family)